MIDIYINTSYFGLTQHKKYMLDNCHQNQMQIHIQASSVNHQTVPAVVRRLPPARRYVSACTNTTDGFEVSLQTNYLSPVLLNRLLLPKLKANPITTGAGGGGTTRVVHVTCGESKNSKADADAVSTAVKRCHPSVAYADSKKLLERHSVVFSSKFESAGVVSNAVDPGPVVSKFALKGGPGTRPRASRRFNPAAIVGWLVGKCTTAAFGPFGASTFFMRSVAHGAAHVAHVAASDATGEKGGRLYADTAGGFTRDTGYGLLPSRGNSTPRLSTATEDVTNWWPAPRCVSYQCQRCVSFQ